MNVENDAVATLVLRELLNYYSHPGCGLTFDAQLMRSLGLVEDHWDELVDDQVHEWIAAREEHLVLEGNQDFLSRLRLILGLANDSTREWAIRRISLLQEMIDRDVAKDLDESQITLSQVDPFSHPEDANDR